MQRTHCQVRSGTFMYQVYSSIQGANVVCQESNHMHKHRIDAQPQAFGILMEGIYRDRFISMKTKQQTALHIPGTTAVYKDSSHIFEQRVDAQSLAYGIGVEGRSGGKEDIS